MFGFGRKKKASPSNDQKDHQISAPSSGIKGSLMSLEQRLMFDAAAAATASEVASEQVAQEQAEAAVSSENHADGQNADQAESQGVLDAIATYNPGESRSEVVFVDPTVPNYQDLLSGMDPNIEVIMLDGGQDGIEQMANALSERTGIDAIHVISHGGAGELQLGTGVLNAESMSTQYADDLAVIQQSLSEQADILVYGCEFAQGEAGQAAVDLLADLTGADVQASNDLTGSISLGGDWEFEVSTGTIETSLAVDYDTQMNWAEVLGTETVADTFSDKSFGNNDGTRSWSSNWSEVDVGASEAKGGHIKVTSDQLRIKAQVVGASVSRGVDLSDASSAKLNFDYNNDLDKGGAVEVRISTDGGKNYRTLSDGIFSKTSHTGSGTASFDISEHMSADTKIQFLVTGSGGGDRLCIDNVQVDYHVADANSAPLDITLKGNTVAENAANGTVVGTAAGSDADAGDKLTYSLKDTAGGRFAINSATGQITVADGSLLNAEVATSHNLTVRVTDSGGLTYDKTFSIGVSNVNEAPTITSNGGGPAATVNVTENQTTVTMVAAMDVDAGTSLTYGIAGGPDAARFSIDSATGALRFSTAPNFERPSDVGRNNVYNVTVQVSDGQGGTATQSISVRVTDVNEAPRITSNRGGDVASVTIRENGTAVTKVRAADPDGGARITYSVVGGADAALFTINPNTGVLHFSSAPNFERPTDTDRNNVYQVVVQASDGRGGADSQVISVRVTNVNEAPTDLSLSANSVAENATTGTVVGTVTDSDPDSRDTKTYSLIDTAGGRFGIDSATGQLTVADGSLLNYEAAASHTVTVRVTDSGGQSYTETFTINLTNVNKAPSGAESTDALTEDMARTLTTSKLGSRDIHEAPKTSSPGSPISNESEESGFILLNTFQNMSQITTEAPSTVEKLIPERTHLSVASEEPIGKGVNSKEAQRLSNPTEKHGSDVPRDQPEVQSPAAAEADRKDFLAPDDPIENEDESMALKMSATMGLAGVVLQNSLGNTTKLSRLISRPARASNIPPNTTTQQSSPDDHASNQDKSEHPRSTAEDADQAAP